MSEQLDLFERFKPSPSLGHCLAPGDCERPRCTYIEPGMGRGASALCKEHLLEALQRMKDHVTELRRREPRAHMPVMPDVSSIR
jgi:hypothetical protein